MKPIYRSLRWLFLASLLTFPMLPLTGCGGGGTADGANADSTAAAQDNGDGNAASDSTAAKDSAKKKKKPRERTTSIRASKVTRSELVVPVIAEGTIRARHSAEIRTEIAGRLDRIHVSEGQSVRRGALLARLDDREYKVAVEEARAEYIRALSLLAIEEEEITVPERSPETQKQIDELKKLEDSGAITPEERLAREIQIDVKALQDGHYRLEMMSARSGIAGARASLERARLYLERTEIRAPFSGVVADLELSEGEQVSMGQMICLLVNNVDIEAEVGVLESDIGKFDVGRPALLAIPALKETLRVNVDVISPEFDRTSRTCDVLLRLKNSDGRVRPGMFVRAMIAGETFENRLLVPKASILTRDGRPLLFKVEGDRAKWLYLQLGEDNDNLVEVTRVLQGGTLSPGDLVVVADHLTLAHDAKVKVKKVLPIQDPWATMK